MPLDLPQVPFINCLATVSTKMKMILLFGSWADPQISGAGRPQVGKLGHSLMPMNVPSLIFSVAEDDGPIVLTDFNRHDAIVALPGREHRHCVIFCCLFGVKSHFVDETLPSIPYNRVGH